MLKLPDKENTGTKRRLVLGFDAGCFTCADMARRVEEKVGDKVEIQNLKDPQLLEWRKEALGEDAPWAPTLFEIRGEKVRAWTGKKMGFQLSRFLGPVSTWRVMQVLGEVGAESEMTESPVAKAAVGISRGQFLKGVSGAAIAMSILSTTDDMASPAEAATKPRNITGDRLVRVAKATLRRRDVINAGGKKWCKKARSSTHIRTCQNGKCATIVGYGGGNCRVKNINGTITVSGDCAIVRAARHRLKNGNSLLAVSYTLDDRVIVYYSYKKSVRRIKTEAKALRVVKKRRGKKLKRWRLRLTRSSHNGRLDAPVRRSRSELRISSADPCGGCSTAPGSRYSAPRCVDYDLYCLASDCAACASCAGVYWNPWLLFGCLPCALVTCPLAMGSTGYCCNAKGAGCNYCGAPL